MISAVCIDEHAAPRLDAFGYINEVEFGGSAWQGGKEYFYRGGDSVTILFVVRLKAGDIARWQGNVYLALASGAQAGRELAWNGDDVPFETKDDVLTDLHILVIDTPALAEVKRLAFA
ncbi:hypothetical protein, partial [Undibacterium sp. Tian12W]|uniref:hypothetical protein n=1 Tax=Undibacterium sp. Tian12W TaxID=3413054 RepID=UPI003BF2C531